MAEQKQEKLGALWRKISNKTQNEFFTGVVKIGDIEKKVVVFEIREKKSDKSPDYEIFEARPYNPDQQKKSYPPAQVQQTQKKPEQAEMNIKTSKKPEDDDLPF